MITSCTKLFAVIGDPIEHSLSPILQNWLLERHDIDGRYVAFHVSPDKLAEAIKGMRALGICGLNVTVPHKEKVLAHLDELSPEARLLGSVNTIVNDNGMLCGFNTDVPGFIDSVAKVRRHFCKSRVLILGAGGAARAVVFALKKLDISELILCDLSLLDTEPLVRKCRSDFGLKNVSGMAIDDGRLSNIVGSCSVLINATPVGMSPHIGKSPLPKDIFLHSGMFVYNLIYNPMETQLLKEAKKAGAVIKNGLDMLIFQGVASMRIWTGKQIHLDESSLTEIRSILNDAMVDHE